jgi:adenylate kinase
MLNVALFGPPGAGKGTQSARLIERYGLHYVATGDILRAEIREGSALGVAARAIIEKGGLVPDEIIVQILEKTIRENTGANGFLFDGFPRTFVQAYILEGLLLKMHTSLMNLVSLEVPQAMCLERLLGRSRTSGRSDDTREVIEYRLREYQEKTAPVLDFYDERGVRVAVDGTGTVDEVFRRITDVLDRSLRKVQLNVVLLGAPGAGRGTQAPALAARYNLAYLATGDLLQGEVRRGTPAGRKAAELLEAGRLVPDEIVIRMIEGTLQSHPDKNGILFKGFPRTLVQAYILDGLLRRIGSRVNCILDIRVPTLELIKRLAARAGTPRAMPYDRATDTIVRRLEEHERYATAIANYYEKTGRHRVIDGVGAQDEVFGRLCAQVDIAFRQAR